MKARPRSAERRVAEILSDFFVSIGASPVERIPVLGRTGPDLTINELGLVVDVKSRLEIPTSYMLTWPTIHAELLAIPLGLLEAVLTDHILKEHPVSIGGKVSVVINRHFEHMDEWKVDHKPNGVTAIVLHKPKMPFGMAQLIIRYSQLPILEERCQQIKLQSTNPVKTLN